jgi:hypothetical protein
MRNAVLVGERVYLRPVEVTDAEDWAAGIAAEPDNFHKRGRIPLSPIALAHWIKERYNERTPAEIFFAVCLKEDDRFIGVVGVDHIDWVNRTGETGSELSEASFRGQGYGTEAKFLLLEYFFDGFIFTCFVRMSSSRTRGRLPPLPSKATNRRGVGSGTTSRTASTVMRSFSTSCGTNILRPKRLGLRLGERPDNQVPESPTNLSVIPSEVEESGFHEACCCEGRDSSTSSE